MSIVDVSKRPLGGRKTRLIGLAHRSHNATRRLVEDSQREGADCWVINTCTVKSPSQSSMSNLITAGKAAGKRLVISGCVPQGDKRLEELHDLSLLGEYGSESAGHSGSPCALRMAHGS